MSISGLPESVLSHVLLQFAVKVLHQQLPANSPYYGAETLITVTSVHDSPLHLKLVNKTFEELLKEDKVEEGYPVRHLPIWENNGLTEEEMMARSEFEPSPIDDSDEDDFDPTVFS